MTTLNAHLVDSAAPDTQATVELFIDNMPQGGGAPGAGSITDAMLAEGAVGEGNIKDGAVSAGKLAAGVLPESATKEKPGLVKQAEHVADAADGDGDALKNKVNELIAALVSAGVMAAS